MKSLALLMSDDYKTKNICLSKYNKFSILHDINTYNLLNLYTYSLINATIISAFLHRRAQYSFGEEREVQNPKNRNNFSYVSQSHNDCGSFNINNNNNCIPIQITFLNIFIVNQDYKRIYISMQLYFINVEINLVLFTAHDDAYFGT